jgi:hypothetical protein
MAYTFATTEWLDAWWEQLRGSEELRTAAASWAHGPMTWTVLADAEAGVPEPITIRIDLHEGEVREVRAYDGNDVAPVPYRWHAGFAKWKALLTGTDDLVDAVLTSRILFEGDLTTVTRHRAAFQTMLALARTLETSWQDEAVAEPAAAG